MTIRRLLTVCVLLGCASLALAQPYAPVTEKDIPQLQLNHYFTPDNKSFMKDFEWTFTKADFVIKKGKAAIPGELLKRLLADGTKADEIRGKWQLDKGDIVLKNLEADGKAVKGEARYRIYRTAPTVIRLGEPQYVFGVGL